MAMAKAALGLVRRSSTGPWRTRTFSSFRRGFCDGVLAVSGDRFVRYASPVPAVVDHTAALAVPETRVTRLPNGLRVATESYLASQTATVGLWIDAGSRYETQATNGTAHFLEHMIFKGTAKRSADKLGEAVEALGGQLDAHTSREQTAYFAKVLKDDVPFAVDLLADIIQNSSFDKNAIEKERQIILQELEEVEGEWDDAIFDHLHATAFQYCPLGRTTIGPPENLKAITRENLVDYVTRHYTAPRMVLVAAGAVEHKDVVELAEKLFTKLSSDPTTAARFIDLDPAVFTGSEVRIRDDDFPCTRFALAVMGAPWTDPDSIALMVMQSMLGFWNKGEAAGKHIGSELAQKVAANDLAESVMAFNINYSDGGLFGVHSVAKPDALDDLSWAIMHEFGRLIYRVAEEDVLRAKNQLKTNLVLHLDTTSAIAEDIGRQLLTYGRRVPLAEIFARIDAVNAATVKRVANRFIYDKELAIAAMGPTQNLPDYNWFRRRTYWLRY